MRKIVAVIGNANIDNDIDKQTVSFELGKLIIDSGFILATGGFGGVMEYASKGAKSSEKYTKNSIIGVLPDYTSEKANEYVDIAIPTGFGLARNLILISMSHAVIAIGGGSGTLNEISAAWQMNKLIIGLQVAGWSEKLCGKPLDKRRSDIIFCAKNAQEAIELLNTKISYYQVRKFTGINKPRITEEKAEKVIKNNFTINSNLSFLGKGSEGFVFTDECHVFKLIDNSQQPLELYWMLLSLSETLQSADEITAIAKFEVSYVNKFVFIKYKYEVTSEFIKHTNIHIEKFINLLKQFHKVKWTLTDFKPQNLRLTEKGCLVVVDIGKSFLPVSDYLFKSMCRRAFVTYKLQGKLSDQEDFNQYLSSVNEKADFSLMLNLDFQEANLNNDFIDFLSHILCDDGVVI